MSKVTLSQSRVPSGPTVPWWRIRMVWLVIGGPALVVVAGIATAVLAIDGRDRAVAAPDAAESTMRGLHHPTPSIRR